MEYYSAVEEQYNATCSSIDATRDSHIKWSKLSEVSQKEQQIPYITYMQNLKYGTNEPIYRTETESQTQRTNLWLPLGMEEGMG